MTVANSIRNLIPLDISGRHARKGFNYQDHIAVGFCMCFMTNPDLKEIWLETHDDILLLWEIEGNSIVEFVQVKAIDLPSRWSVPAICGSGNSTDSIVKKLMDQDRCSEPVLFRIVSSYDVDTDVAVLKKGINSIERNAEVVKENELSAAIKKKLGDIKSPNGKNIHDWVQKCFWEKKADNIDDLISSNKIGLEKALEILGRPILSDQRDEIYQKMLSYCQSASSENMRSNPNCYKIKRQAYVDWLSTSIDSLYTPSAGLQKLEEKLQKAKNVPSDYILNAKQLKWDYTGIRLRNDFIQASEISSLETVIHGELYKLKIALDNGEEDEDHFHKVCTDKLDYLKDSTAFKNKNIPDCVLTGYMYDLTSKCLHRFRKVTP